MKAVFDGIWMGVLLAVLLPSVVLANGTPPLQGEVDCRTEAGINDRGDWIREPSPAAIATCEAAAQSFKASPDTLAYLGLAYYWAERHEDARRVLEAAQEKGSALAVALLGVMYANGLGVEKDEAQAVVWYRKAAEQGQAVAQTNLGWMYESGRGVEKDEAQAVAWYRKAAEQGEARAQANLGVMYANGRGLEKDEAQAVAWYRKAAEQGQPVAQTNLGVMYANGRGLEKDEAQAVAWFRKAAEQGEARAQTNLGAMYESGRGVEKDEAQAVVWYRKAAEQGEATAQRTLGVMYLKGLGVPVDETQAMQWLEKAAEQGDPSSTIVLDALYRANSCMLNRQTQTIDWLMGAAEQGNSQAQVDLAEMYSCGSGVQQDQALAAKWYRQAAEQGDARAQLRVGTMYRTGEGIEQDYLQALKWYQQAAEQGNAGAQNYLGLMYMNGLGVERDDAQAVKWYRQAAEKGDASAQNNLGVMYMNGLGVDKDEAHAMLWFAKAAEQGDANAQRNLGLIYQWGRTVGKDDALAVQSYRQAAEQDLSAAQFSLGLMYQNGWGVEADPAIAADWYRKAVKNGDEMAKVNLGVLIAQGSEVALPDLEQAHRLWRSSKAPEALLQIVKRFSVPEALAVLDQRTVDEPDQGMLERIAYLMEAQLFSEGLKVAEAYFESPRYRHSPEYRKKDALDTLRRMLANVTSARFSGEVGLLTLRGLARLGIQEASEQIGHIYAQGRGVERNDGEAARWYHEAAMQGNPNAQLSLGWLYAEGRGVEKSDAEAVRWYQKSAAQGNAFAQINLGLMYAEGRGVEKSDAEAVRWYQKAAAQGNARAQFNLGWMYAEGRGVERSDAEAVHWYQKAAAQDNTDAQHNLAAMRAEGRLGGELDGSTSNRDIRALSATIPGLIAAHRWADVAKTYRQIADWHLATNQIDEALAAYLQALNATDIDLATFYGSPDNYFHLLRSSCEWAHAAEWSLRIGRRDAALLMAKFAVNRLQQARQQLDALDDSLKECFLKVHEDRYRWLADLMVSMGRLGEAEQVITMLKNFEVEEYVRRGDAPRESARQELPFDARERNVLRTAEGLAEQARAVATAERLKRLRSSRALSDAEQAEWAANMAVLKAGQEDFKMGKEALLAELRALGQPDAGESAREAAVASSASIQKTLGKVFKGRAVVLLWVVLPHRTHLLVTTAQTQQVVSVDISSADLSLKVAAVRQAIQNPSVDARPLAQELYRLLIAPVEPLFKDMGIDTLMISADNVLRYIPFAALHDGQGYLIERYALSNYSPLTRDLLVAPAERATWRVAAFGASKGQPERGFEPLPNVASELRAVVREPGEQDGAMPGQRKLDEQFTRVSFSDSLKADFPAVHLASHFRLRFGDQLGTALLLGDGQMLPLSDLVNDRLDFNLGSVDLLTLSACDTAVPVGRDSATGSEVESLAKLVHQAGASSVLATLWPVADRATSRFMQGLYGYLAADSGITKADALRRVQLDFIREGGAAADPPTETRAAMRLGVPALPRQAVSLSHPYFWAPFALLGNWL